MMARLVGGQGTYEGRLEINTDDVWGTVCSNSFDRQDAQVACKYLGHPDVEEVHTTTEVSDMSIMRKPIWMSGLECTGEEYSPFDCKQSPVGGNHGCTHDQDVSLKCVSKRCYYYIIVHKIICQINFGKRLYINFVCAFSKWMKSMYM